jgi:hypothetical protein
MTQQFIVQGRIVFGHPLKGRPKKDIRTKQPIIKDGQPVIQYVFGVAIDKAIFGAQVWPYLQNEARAAFPNGAPQNFTYKFKDGDTNDAKGQPFSKREGYAGHCVLTISTEGFAPQVFKQGQGGYVQIGAEEIKCGDYVAVNVTVKYNGAVSPNTPGLYVNPNAVIHIGYGQEIVSAGQDPDELFAGFTAQLPPGASATPVMGHAPMPTGMQPAMQPAPGYPPAPAAPQYGAPPTQAAPYPPQPAAYGAPAQPAHLPPPAHDFVQNAVAGAPAGYPPANPGYPPAPAAPQYGAPPSPQPYAAPAANPPAPTPYPPMTANASGAAPYPSNQGYPGMTPGR